MHQFNEAVEKNGFTHKDAKVVVRGKLSGTAGAPFWKSPEPRTAMPLRRRSGPTLLRCSGKR